MDNFFLRPLGLYSYSVFDVGYMSVFRNLNARRVVLNTRVHIFKRPCSFIEHVRCAAGRVRRSEDLQCGLFWPR